MKISCIAVDDEPLALDQLRDFISRVPYLELRASFMKGFEAMMYINDNNVDLVFLDIQMEDITGIQLIKTIKTKPAIIITSAYDQFAIEGYELDVSDYLLKPISFERFVKAVEKIYCQKSIKEKSVEVIHNTENSTDFIFVKADYRLQKINLDDILYIEGYKDYLRFFLTEKRKIMSLMSFRNLEESLPKNRFYRIHKSFIVAIDKIESIGKSSITIGETQIPIGNFFKDDFFEFLNQRNLLK
ncbi:MAG: LytR/AlgR family response regulator transcription factor [Bacteroidales bacterium]